jgi:hypothetical protein
MPRSLALLVLALPIAALAQAPAVSPTPPAEPTPPAAAAPAAEPAPPQAAPPQSAPPAPPAPPSPAVAAPTAPAAPAAPAAAAPAPAPKQGVVVEWGGWFQTHAWRNFGALNPTATGTTDLPLYVPPTGSDAAGLSVRQSRLRAAVTLPTDGLLHGAKLKGLVEMDFMGPLASAGDHSLPAVRLRHAWVAAIWKEQANLTLLVGQNWGVFTGPHFAVSLAHLAVPRFGGAGFLYRRAPQVRVAAEGSGPVALSVQLAALAPYDKATSGVGNDVIVGERSGIPDFEGRVALLVKPGGKPLLELGVSGHYGEELYFLDGTGKDGRVKSWGAAADLRFDLPYVTVVGGAWYGDALGVMNPIAKEVRFTTTSGKNVAVDAVTNMGGWAQLILTPVTGLQLVAGYGIENPEVDDLPFTVPTDPNDPAAVAAANAANAKVVNRNQQVSGGILVNLTSKWRVSTEVTWFVTNTQDRFERNATQLEIGSLYAF